MEVKYVFKLLLKWLWLFVLIPVIAGAGAYYVSAYKTVYIYEAKATLYIVNSSDDPEPMITAVYGNIISAQNVVENYVDIIKSKSAINEALNKLNLKEYSAERFSGNINLIFPTMDSFVVGINVRDTDPKLASDMANKLSEILVDRTYKLMQISVIEILDRAEIPAYPANDKTKKNVSVAIMAGIKGYRKINAKNTFSRNRKDTKNINKTHVAPKQSKG
jgi:capsular polysaccharide biosynthesis protein